VRQEVTQRTMQPLQKSNHFQFLYKASVIFSMKRYGDDDGNGESAKDTKCEKYAPTRTSSARRMCDPPYGMMDKRWRNNGSRRGVKYEATWYSMAWRDDGTRWDERGHVPL